MEISQMSARYDVRQMREENISEIYDLCRENTLFYQYCPPFVTEESIAYDLKALPPGKDLSDKYYLGYFEGGKLIAVMDLILGYPDAGTAFIGFFMTDVSVQNSGVGSGIISELCEFLTGHGFQKVRLGWAEGNPQARAFWHKNGFTETGETYDSGDFTVITAQREL